MFPLKQSAIILLAAAMLTLAADAKVFWAWPTARGRAVLETNRDWKKVYTGSVLINDGQGHLTIIACAEPLVTVMAKLRQAYAACETLENIRQTETLGWAQLREDDRIVTLMALAPNVPEQTLLFVLTQTPDEAEKSRGPPSAPRLADPPPYPNSRVQTHLTSEESKMQVEIYTAETIPEAVRQYYAGALRARAWTRIDPAGAAASLAIYQKDAELCVLLVLPTDAGTGSTITVLHKRLKME